MMIASAPSTPAAQSSARWPDENVRGGGGRRPPVDGRDRWAAADRPLEVAATLVGVADGIAAGEARPGGGVWLGLGGRRPARTAATASANGPPLR